MMAAHRARLLVVMNMFVRRRLVLLRRRIKGVSIMGSSLEGSDRGDKVVRVRSLSVEKSRWLGRRVGVLYEW